MGSGSRRPSEYSRANGTVSPPGSVGVGDGGVPYYYAGGGLLGAWGLARVGGWPVGDGEVDVAGGVGPIRGGWPVGDGEMDVVGGSPVGGHVEQRCTPKYIYPHVHIHAYHCVYIYVYTYTPMYTHI